MISSTIRIICGRGSDGNRGDHHRAIDVARQLHTIDKWDGQHAITIHNPHDLHRELQLSGEPAIYSAGNVYPGAHALVEGEHYEIDDPEAAAMLAAAREVHSGTLAVWRSWRGADTRDGKIVYAILAEYNHVQGPFPKAVADTILHRLKRDHYGYLGCTVSGYDRALEKWTVGTSFVVRGPACVQGCGKRVDAPGDTCVVCAGEYEASRRLDF